jgi:hypothetical protein
MISSTILQEEAKSMTLSISEPQRSCDFKELLLDAVDAALSSFGDSSKQAIYFYLERNFTVKKQEIPNKVEEFANAIEEMFGYGAKILEIEIMKHLYVKIGSSFEYFPEKEDLLFVDYIDAARMHVHPRHH